MHHLARLFSVLALLGPLARRAAGVELLGVAEIPGTASDKSGLTDKLPDGTPHDRLGAMGSGIAFTGHGNRYLLVADRGPKDGLVPYRCRFHEFEIVVKPGAKPAVEAKLLATTLLSNRRGEPLVGDVAALPKGDPGDGPRFDPEAVRMGRTGTVFLSDEYGPCVCEFDRRGKCLRVFAIPKKFQIEKPSKSPPEEVKNNPTGRAPNRGFEGLAISPDGAKLFALLQSSLLQDGGATRKGHNVRLLEINVQDGATRQLVYQLDSPNNGLNEIVAVNATQFLVIERDSKAGKEAEFKRILRIDLRDASDVSAVPVLPEKGLPEGVRPVKKELFLDLLDPKFGLAGPHAPEKIEGLAFGPDLPDGRRLLLVTSDNDFKADEPTRIYAFALDKSDLPAYEAQQFDVPREKPEAKADPLEALNREARAVYAARRAERLARAYPVLVVDGEELTLLRGREKLAAKLSLPRYHQLKSIAHAPLGVYLLLAGHERLDKQEQEQLARLHDAIAAAKAALGDYNFPRGQRERQETILDDCLGLLAACRKDGGCSKETLAAFTRRQGPLVLASVAEAAKEQIDALHAQVKAWRKLLPAEEWARLKVIVCGSQMPRRDNLAVQYFAKLLGEKGEGTRIIYAEALYDEDKVLRLLGTHLQDRAIGQAFFDDPQRMQRDLLADAAAAYLRTLEVKE